MFLRKLSEYFSRKFILSGGSLLGSFVLVWNDKDVDGMLGIIAAVLGSYNGANVFQTYLDNKSKTPPAGAPVNDVPLE